MVENRPFPVFIDYTALPQRLLPPGRLIMEEYGTYFPSVPTIGVGVGGGGVGGECTPVFLLLRKNETKGCLPSEWLLRLKSDYVTAVRWRLSNFKGSIKGSLQL